MEKMESAETSATIAIEEIEILDATTPRKNVVLAPVCSTLWFFPCLDKKYGKVTVDVYENNKKPCSACYYCFPCCCCCCRPLLKKEMNKVASVVDFDSIAEVPYDKDEIKEENTSENGKISTEFRGPRIGAYNKKNFIIKNHTSNVEKNLNSSLSKSKVFKTFKHIDLLPNECIGEPPKLPDNFPGIEDLSSGLYLVYSFEMSSGSLYQKWSQNSISIPGTLLYAKNEKRIPDFKFKNGGSTTLAKELTEKFQSDFLADIKIYYTAVTEFLREAKNFDSKILLLPSTQLQPPPSFRLYGFNNDTVIDFEVGKFYDLNEFESISVVPAKFQTFEKLKKIKKQVFLQHSQAVGDYITF